MRVRGCRREVGNDRRIVEVFVECVNVSDGWFVWYRIAECLVVVVCEGKRIDLSQLGSNQRPCG